MPVHAAARQHKSPVHGRALRLVDGHGIAVIERGIGLGLDDPALAVVEHHGQPCPPAASSTLPKRSVFDAKLPVVFQEDDAVSRRELPLALFGRKDGRLAEFARLVPRLPDRFVQIPHIGAGMSEDQGAFAVLPAGHPVARDRGLGLLAAGLEPHMPSLLVGARAPSRTRPLANAMLAVPRPFLVLAPDGADPSRVHTVRDCPESAPASMGCNCWASPTSTTLAPALGTSASTRPSWRLPIMPASSITSTSRGPSRSLPCAQAHSSEAMVRLSISEPSCKPSAALPASAAPRARNPWASHAARAALSIVDLPAPAAPATAAMPLAARHMPHRGLLLR